MAEVTKRLQWSFRLFSALLLLLGFFAPTTEALYLLRKRYAPNVYSRHLRISTDVRATVCNGRAELCDRRYGNTTFLTAHNSFAFSSNPLARKL
jgi:hypothetical protein